MSNFSIKTGTEYLCTTTVVGEIGRDDVSGESIRITYYIAGKIYKSEWWGCITDEGGEVNHHITLEFGALHFVEINELNKLILKDSALFSSLFVNPLKDEYQKYYE